MFPPSGGPELFHILIRQGNNRLYHQPDRDVQNFALSLADRCFSQLHSVLNRIPLSTKAAFNQVEEMSLFTA